MKKRILIVNNNMHIGGVQKALINLLTAVHDKYDITLLLFHPAGEYMSDIPKDITVISVKSGYRYLGMTKYDVKGHPLFFLKRSFYAALTRFFGRNAAISMMSVFQKKLKGYDAAVSYLQNGADKAFYGGCNDFVIRHTEADIKASVLHCDYGKCGANTKLNARLYSEFDRIAACSEGCRASFVEVLPELADRTLVVRNCHDYKNLDELSRAEKPELTKDRINILSVARLGKEKGVLRAVRVISRLGKYKDKVHFYIIGDGIERDRINMFIAENSLSDTVTCLGERANPYPYMCSADLLLISSFSEAAPMVIGESAYLGAPILSTRTSSAIEMIEESDFGWVCENNEDSLLEILSELVASPERINNKKTALKNIRLTNDDAIAAFDKLLNQHF